MPKEATAISNFAEMTIADGKDLNERMNSHLLSSLAQCHAWAYSRLTQQPFARVEHKVRKKLEETIEASMMRKVEEALGQFEAVMSR